VTMCVVQYKKPKKEGGLAKLVRIVLGKKLNKGVRTTCHLFANHSPIPLLSILHALHAWTDLSPVLVVCSCLDEQISNWGMRPLRESQLTYAALVSFSLSLRFPLLFMFVVSPFQMRACSPCLCRMPNVNCYSMMS
jgi:hypothetical protein